MSKETFSSVSVNSGYLLRLDSSGSIYFRINNNGARIVSSSNGTIQTGSIYHAFTTFDGTKVSGYVNGVLIGTSSYVGTVGSSTNTLEISRNFDGYRVTGSIYLVQVYNRALSATEVLQNYNALSGRFGKTPTITDYDALNFVNAASISNETQQIAINTLTTDLKNAGLWSKMKAIYPFVGGTAATHKWNLKDPRDLDAAYRLTFFGGWTHSSTGAKPNGTTGYADTYFVANGVLTLYNGHLSYYSRTSKSPSSDTFPIGTGANSGNWNGREVWCIRFGTTSSFYAAQQHSQLSYPTSSDYPYISQSNYQGYWIQSRRTSDTSTLKLIKNGNAIASASGENPTGQALNIYSVFIGALRNLSAGSPYAYAYTDAESGFATIGDGLTDAEASSLYTIVQKYQTTLGRQV
jgi:hypothetical protein